METTHIFPCPLSFSGLHNITMLFPGASAPCHHCGILCHVVVTVHSGRRFMNLLENLDDNRASAHERSSE